MEFSYVLSPSYSVRICFAAGRLDVVKAVVLDAASARLDYCGCRSGVAISRCLTPLGTLGAILVRRKEVGEEDESANRLEI
ncbi:unnamed protein product [Cuscuta campestris]|uniref:Uncharacterized protein n=1 Tax=Cuscuta campestris TaxID=132261 RepID=A0A484NPB1_9ASTE|nr:unnamed protein product [Cuscuta campestris]